MIQGKGWYLGSDLDGHTSPKTGVPGLSFQSGEYCVQGPSDWAKFYMQEPYRNATGSTEQQVRARVRVSVRVAGDASAAHEVPNALDRTLNPTLNQS